MPLPAALLLMLAALPALASAAPDAPKAPDCPGLAALPPGVSSPEDKRITCEIPGPLRLQVQESEARGLLLRRHDLAAWLATDALKALHAFDAPAGQDRGWLTREVDGGVEVRYFRNVAGQTQAFASAVFDDESGSIRDVRRLTPAIAADEHELRLLTARDIALGQSRLQCSSGLNTVILEEPGFNEVRVYVFSAWDEHAAPMGGHARFLVSTDGTKLLDAYQQTNTCLDFPTDPGSVIEVDDAHAGPPSELQVFLQRQYDVPVRVKMSGDGSVWKIEGGLLHLEQEGK